jgi:mannosyl-oligosaccharide alpha-1,2-mannosidase
MADGLQPVSGVKKSQFCSWSATLIDSLDTLYIMGLYDDFDAAVNATLTIDFAHNVIAQYLSSKARSDILVACSVRMI